MSSDVKVVKLTASGTIFAGPARIKSIYYVAAASAGSIQIKDGGSGGTVVADYGTPGLATWVQEIEMQGDGVLCSQNAFATLTNVTSVTIQYA